VSAERVAPAHAFQLHARSYGAPSYRTFYRIRYVSFRRLFSRAISFPFSLPSPPLSFSLSLSLSLRFVRYALLSRRGGLYNSRKARNRGASNKASRGGDSGKAVYVAATKRRAALQASKARLPQSSRPIRGGRVNIAPGRALVTLSQPPPRLEARMRRERWRNVSRLAGDRCCDRRIGIAPVTSAGIDSNNLRISIAPPASFTLHAARRLCRKATRRALHSHDPTTRRDRLSSPSHSSGTRTRE